MEIKSLYPIITVEDVEAAKKFYCDILNFKVKHAPVRKDGGQILVLCNDAGFELEIMEIKKDCPVKMEPGLFGLRMNVSDIDAAAEELKANGYEAQSKVIVTDMGKNLIIKDNNGVSITLIQHIKK